MPATLAEVAKPVEAAQPDAELARQLHQQSEEIEALRQRVAYLERLVPKWQETASYFEVKNALEQVTSIARELFSEGFQVEECADWDVEGERYFEFNVPVRDEVELDSILKKQDEWYKRLCMLPSNVRYKFHLSIG